MVMDRSAMVGHLETLLAALTRARPAESPPAARIVLAGGACSLTDVHQAIEAAGAAVVWDDLCTGTRAFTGAIDAGNDPVAAIARRYAERVVCPAKHAGLDARGLALRQAVKDSRADGVIFVVLKFCDPHLFDYPYLKSALDHGGIPSLMLEIEDRPAGTGQFQTRIEAFVEMLSASRR
jgi:benzoyl-CoA reductase/2-hydroxyglutaryl-CoA dehydratase subunit BcrC/BadD/HgdB